MSRVYTLLWEDSELTRCEAPAAGELHWLFAAAQVRTADGELGWLRGLRLVFRQAVWTGDIALAQGRIRHAHGLRPFGVPGSGDEPVAGSFTIGHDTVLDIRAASWEAVLSTDGKFIASMAC
jgi:hypothetical protein